MTYAFSPQWKTPINKLDVKRKKETRNYTDLKESNELHHNRWNCMMQYKNLLNLDLRSFDEKPTIDSSTFVAARYNIHIDIIVRASTKINGTLMVIQRLSSFFYWCNPRYVLHCIILGTSICWLKLHRSKLILNCYGLQKCTNFGGSDMQPLTFLKSQNIIGYIRLKAYGKA